MENTKLSKAGRRRLNNRARELKTALAQDEARFLRLWKNLLNGWISEIHFRAREWRAAGGRGSGAEEPRVVFSVFVIAERLLAQCGPRVEQLVGPQTRRRLNAESVKALMGEPGTGKLTLRDERRLRN